MRLPGLRMRNERQFARLRLRDHRAGGDEQGGARPGEPAVAATWPADLMAPPPTLTLFPGIDATVPDAPAA
jgi:hypothetical protein